ncbi:MULTISPECIES: DUF6400 family protein [unclassified Streptomyces]|uniref:DUF6400 family protein n=1 Tax=unclassified Streptomyces TaxID=2593676 RepID=UPI0038010B51
MTDRNTSDHQIFDVDLAGHEARRRTEVLAALGDTWNPVEVMEAESAAQRLLYSGLDAEQQATYDMLVTAGVLPASGQD